MSNNTIKQESRAESFRNESTRQRWDLFHRAIAHAKQSNVAALEEAAESEAERQPVAVLQSIQG
ncbi:MAG: hypothetical protein U5K76_00045 [Woeseiaceae bacterium]|nr:hypothetical protein [Woeseiaceae bacterium]